MNDNRVHSRPARISKQIAAVCYLLGERFDEDPFLIFQMRVCTRDQVIDALRALRAVAVPEIAEPEPAAYETAPRWPT